MRIAELITIDSRYKTPKWIPCDLAKAARLKLKDDIAITDFATPRESFYKVDLVDGDELVQRIPRCVRLGMKPPVVLVAEQQARFTDASSTTWGRSQDFAAVGAAIIAGQQGIPVHCASTATTEMWFHASQTTRPDLAAWSLGEDGVQPA